MGLETPAPEPGLLCAGWVQSDRGTDCCGNVLCLEPNTITPVSSQDTLFLAANNGDLHVVKVYAANSPRHHKPQSRHCSARAWSHPAPHC